MELVTLPAPGGQSGVSWRATTSGLRPTMEEKATKEKKSTLDECQTMPKAVLQAEASLSPEPGSTLSFRTRYGRSRPLKLV